MFDVFADAASSRGVRARRFGICLDYLFNQRLSFVRIYRVMDLFWISIILSSFIAQEMLETNSEEHAILAGGNESHYFECEDGSAGSWDDHTGFPGMNSVIVIYPKI